MAKKPDMNLVDAQLPVMSDEDWVLLILALEHKGRSSNCAALMNEVFWFLKESAPAVEEEFGFRGTGFGPYSPRVAGAVNALTSDGFLEMRRDHNLGIELYSPTEKGLSKAEELLARFSERERHKIRYLRFLALRLGGMGTQQYLSSVHPGHVFVRTVGDAPV